MGYYNGSDLPVYDHLVREFCVCDRWFSSVPGATWPNRLYAVAGQAAGSLDPQRVPIYDKPTFVRHLERNKVSWGWYAHDVGTLRFSDSQFYLGYLDKFKYFDRRSFLAPRNFLDDAKDGKLPAVSWIDPNFVDVSFIGPSGSNDDHPPSDIKAGQELVLKVYSALVKSPNWKKTMLVITYDEHGGFYDHVLPHPAQDDKPAFRTYGVRVPSIVVSPFTARASVSSVVYDHTSIIKTILMRFCEKNGQIPDMGARVRNANHLGDTLTLASARPPTPVGGVPRCPRSHQQLADRRVPEQGADGAAHRPGGSKRPERPPEAVPGRKEGAAQARPAGGTALRRERRGRAGRAGTATSGDARGSRALAADSTRKPAAARASK